MSLLENYGSSIFRWCANETHVSYAPRFFCVRVKVGNPTLTEILAGENSLDITSCCTNYSKWAWHATWMFVRMVPATRVHTSLVNMGHDAMSFQLAHNAGNCLGGTSVCMPECHREFFGTVRCAFGTLTWLCNSVRVPRICSFPEEQVFFTMWRNGYSILPCVLQCSVVREHWGGLLQAVGSPR